MGLRRALEQHYKQVLSTIKMLDVEERFDLYFSRFFGLFFAKAGRFFRLTPTQVSVISLIIGIVGGGLLYYQEFWKITLIGSLCITIAGVLDSADGQLARMTGQSSETGRIIDGLIDNLVFASCYVGGTIYFIDEYNYWVLFVAVLAGIAHSLKSALYEFYKTEYLYFAGPFENARIAYPEEIKDQIASEKSLFKRLLNYTYLDYTARQFRLSTRTRELRDRFGELAYNNKTQHAFTTSYRRLNHPLLFWWALICGSNTHRSLIMISSLLGRFDVYLIISIITIIPMLVINQQQKKIDSELEREFL
ncbi:MAG: CDP-alcohol phosphatidyltransferase family protein [Cyclobacteriaceae bacterium]